MSSLSITRIQSYVNHNFSTRCSPQSSIIDFPCMPCEMKIQLTKLLENGFAFPETFIDFWKFQNDAIK